MATEDKIIKDAQYRKGLSIAFFNAVNNATQIVELEKANHWSEEQIKERISYWRDWLLEEHKDYYSKVIAQVGLPYNSTETIEKLKKAETKEELRLMWLALSADEKHDGDVLKVAKELKKTLK